ncbi:MAG: siroheme synthase [Sphingopyxis sp.]|nr:siroheme synthase [Sphingopyxis sp.]
MDSLPIFVRLGGRSVVLVGEGEAADAKRRLIERAGGRIVDGADAAGAALAFVAMDDDEEARAVAAMLRAQGLLVNVVDQPGDCDFTTPAIVDRAPLLIAVGTGGASAGLAKAVRQRIEALLPASLGALALALQSIRPRLRALLPSGADRRRAIDAALIAGGPLDPLTDHGDAASTAVDRWLDGLSGASPDNRGQLIALTITSDDPEDLTLRAARLMGMADAIWHRGDIAPDVLNRARADAARHIADQQPAAPETGLWLWLDKHA